jgi:hypothetical protein
MDNSNVLRKTISTNLAKIPSGEPPTDRFSFSTDIQTAFSTGSKVGNQL